MFGTMGIATARSRYRDVDVATKIEGASPHRLVAILFEELDRTLQTIAAGLTAGTGAFRGGMPERRARAVSILSSLEGTLDHEAGGELAARLAAIYREGRRLIADGLRENDPDRIVQARTLIGAIAEAWETIA